MEGVHDGVATATMATDESTPDPNAVDVPRYLGFFLAVYVFVVGTVGGIGNALVIYIFQKTKSLQTPGNLLIVNLAVSDIIMVISQFTPLFFTTVAGKWVYGDIGCQIYAFFGSTFGIMSISSMSAISVDRYYAICRPMKSTRKMSRRRSKYIIAIVWLYSLAWSVPPFFGFGHYTREGYGLSCTFDYEEQTLINMCFVGMLFTTDFILPFSLIVGCYTNIVRTFRAHNKEMSKIVDNQKSDDAFRSKKLENEKKEFKIAKIGMLMTTVFCIAWLPYATVAFVSQFIDPTIVNPLLQTLPVVFAKSSSVLNPIVYAITHEKFKTALTERFLHTCCVKYERDVAAGHKLRIQNMQQRDKHSKKAVDNSITDTLVTRDTSLVIKPVSPRNPPADVQGSSALLVTRSTNSQVVAADINIADGIDNIIMKEEM